MMLGRLTFLLSTLLCLVGAAPVQENYVVHERRDALPSAWVKRDRLPADRRLPMRIALTQSELENAEKHLMSVSHPDSPQYGLHWDKEKVVNTFRPSEVTEDRVRQWLADYGIGAERINHSADKAWFSFYAAAEEAETLLATEFHDYEHTDTGTLMPSCEQYHLPKHVSPHVDFVTPGTTLTQPGSLNRRAPRSEALPQHQLESLSEIQRRKVPNIDPKTNVDSCAYAITPACIASLYNISSAPQYVNPNNSMGIFESNLEFWVQSDLDTWFTNYTNIPNGTHPVAANIDGGLQTLNDPDYAGYEVTLDLTIAYPIVYPQKIVNYQVDDIVYQTGLTQPVLYGGFNTFLDALDGSYCNFTAYNETGNHPYDPVYPDPNGGWQGDLQCGTAVVTNVISISYGAQEVDVPLSYQKRQCLEFLKLGLQGVSILVASGDSGAANDPPGYGYGTPGCLGMNEDILSPQWPSNCPWLTSVGATRLYPGQSVKDAESSLERPSPGPDSPYNFSSGGGFSNVYLRPDYQKSAVEEYFKNHDPDFPYYSRVALDTNNITKQFDPDFLAGNSGGIYNRIGRAYPDVSANGKSAAVIVGGEWVVVSGTSMSTPLFAAVINRINEERLHVNKTVLGFLNPALYNNPSMLNDITNGSTFGCNGPQPYYNATPGWDPTTGLGTPNYPKMLEYFMGLP